MGGFAPTIKEKKDLAAGVPEIPKALAAGVQRDILGAPGKAIQFAGEAMKAQRIPTAAPKGPGGFLLDAVQSVRLMADKAGFAGGVKVYDKTADALTKAGKFMSDFWEEQASTGWEAPDPDLMEQKWNRPIQYGTRVTMESAPTFAAAIGAGYVTGSPNVSLAMMGAFEKLNSFTKQMEGGASFQKANIISTLSGTWEAVTEKIPFDFILKGKTKSRLIKAVTSGGLESMQELLAGMGQNFLEHFGYKAKDWKTVPGAIKEGLKHTFDNWLESVVAGGVLGGGAGAVFTGRGTKELDEFAKKLGVPIKGLTPEAAVRKIDQVVQNRRAVERVDEITDPEALKALLESPFLTVTPKPAPTEAAVAPEPAVKPPKAAEPTITPPKGQAVEGGVFEQEMFHGTEADITKIDTSDRQFGNVAHAGGDNVGAFFTSSQEGAERFGIKIHKKTVKIDNPLRFKTQEEFRTFLRENTSPKTGLAWTITEYPDAKGEYFVEGKDSTGEIKDSKSFKNENEAKADLSKRLSDEALPGGQEAIKALGYDGIVIEDAYGDGTEAWAIAFDAKQISDQAVTKLGEVGHKFTPAEAVEGGVVEEKCSIEAVLSSQQPR
ncbi:MAG: ADP-ribosyltransferase-containing protein [Planctomycetota bacterium]